LSHLLAIPVLAAALAACVGYGWVALQLLGLPDRPTLKYPLPAIYAAALGMGTLAYLILGIGLAGYLRLPFLIGLVAFGWVLLAIAWLRSRASKAEPPPDRTQEETSGERYAALMLSVFVGLLAVVTLFSALKPVDGLDWDSLSYHLAAAKIYLHDGRIGLIAYDNHTNFPFTLEMLYTLGLAFQGSAAAKLFHWACAWMTAAAVGFWASRLEISGRQAPMWVGPLAAALFGSMPVALWEAGTGYIDLGTALFQFLSLAALVDSIRCSDREEAPCRSLGLEPRRAVLAGILAGFALGTKYTALLHLGILGLGLLWLLFRSGGDARPAAFRGLLVFGIAAVAVASPWYVKNWFWVHNPVYPFFYRLFPHSFSWSISQSLGYENEQKAFGLPRTPATFALLFWNLALHGREFYANGKNPVGDMLGSVGIAWAGLLPLVLWVRGLGWRVWTLAAYALGSITLWFFMSQQIRYLIPVFAPLAVVVAISLARASGLPRLVGNVFAGAALIFNLGCHVPVAMSGIAYLTGGYSDSEFLKADANFADGYAASEWINTHVPPNGRIALYEETRGFYLDRGYLWANPGHHDLIPYDQLKNGRDLVDYLRRFGVTHVWLTTDFLRGKEGASWYRLLAGAIQTGELQRVWSSPRAEQGRGGVTLFQLRPARERP
jgi:hypothetical protein